MDESRSGGPTEVPGEDINDLMRRRREELEGLRSRGIEPYPHTFERDALSIEVITAFKDEAPLRVVSIAGRIMSIRRMGKASFCHIQDSAGRIQAYLKRDEIGESYDSFRLYDIGDIVGITGHVFRTKAGEVSVHAKSVALLAKSLRPLPVVKERIDEQGNKVVYDPFSDKELRYRQRYVDLVVNKEVREVFMKRALIISVMRKFFDERGYLEVETPVLQPIYGGASARPFKTHHNALDVDLYLRIADELYLKRLIVGGFDAVYEVSKDFRNEGMDRTHNPEFTMLELYVAYKDYRWMMSLVEDLLATVVRELSGGTTVSIGGRAIDFTPPWRRVTFFDALREHTGLDLLHKEETELRKVAKRLGIEVDALGSAGGIIDAIFSVRVEPNLVEPTFIIDYPVELSPLAKKHRSIPGLVERFEGFVNGKEICNAFTELNDPLDQRSRFEEQTGLRARGDEEAQVLDDDYLRALEYGMPHTAGLGIGIDRLTMLMTDQDSIRDVILFPQMKPER